MELLSILEEQKDLLSQIKEVVLNEKQVLINNDTRTLVVLVEKKIELMNVLEKTEQMRRALYGDRKINEIDVPLKDRNKVEALVFQSKKIFKEIEDLQQTNSLLTQQSMDYQNNMLLIVQQAIEKSGSVYSEKGRMEGQKVHTSIDKSV